MDTLEKVLIDLLEAMGRGTVVVKPFIERINKIQEAKAKE